MTVADVPGSSDSREPSGRFEVRVGRSLHRALLRQAEREGISLNQLVNLLLARLVNWDEEPDDAPAPTTKSARRTSFGANKPSYTCREREDGWLEVRVLNQNRHFRAVLDEHANDGRYFLAHLPSYRRGLRAQVHLAHLIDEWRPFFESNKVEFLLEPDGD